MLQLFSSKDYLNGFQKVTLKMFLAPFSTNLSSFVRTVHLTKLVIVVPTKA